MSLSSVSKSCFLPFLPFLFFPVRTLINTLPFDLLSLLYNFLFGLCGSQKTSASSSSLFMLSVMTRFFGRPLFLLTTFSFSCIGGLCPLSSVSAFDVSYLLFLSVLLFFLSQHPLFLISKFRHYFFVSALFFLVHSIQLLLCLL